MNIDTFNTKTFDGYPVELTAALEQDNATIRIPGLIQYRIAATLPKDDAFKIFNEAFVLTYSELRKTLNI